jgi:hypothetical protein
MRDRVSAAEPPAERLPMGDALPGAADFHLRLGTSETQPRSRCRRDAPVLPAPGAARNATAPRRLTALWVVALALVV